MELPNLEKLGVLENGVLFIAAVIIMRIILISFLFLIIFHDLQDPVRSSAACLSDLSLSDSAVLAWLW